MVTFELDTWHEVFVKAKLAKFKENANITSKPEQFVLPEKHEWKDYKDEISKILLRKGKKGIYKQIFGESNLWQLLEASRWKENASWEPMYASIVER